jgi:hypothetical protein
MYHPVRGIWGQSRARWGLLALVSSWGSPAVPAAGARHSTCRYEALTCFANASTDALRRRVILPRGISLAPLSPISD